MQTFFYICYHLPTGKKIYRKKKFKNRTNFLEALDRDNAAGRGVWQYHSATPGYAAPRNEYDYEWA